MITKINGKDLKNCTICEIDKFIENKIGRKLKVKHIDAIKIKDMDANRLFDEAIAK
jgi:hypothetical protein